MTTPRLLYGVREITAHLVGAERVPQMEGAIRHQIESGRLPTFKLGQIICAYTDGLDDHLRKSHATAVTNTVGHVE